MLNKCVQKLFLFMLSSQYVATIVLCRVNRNTTWKVMIIHWDGNTFITQYTRQIDVVIACLPGSVLTLESFIYFNGNEPFYVESYLIQVVCFGRRCCLAIMHAKVPNSVDRTAGIAILTVC